MLCCLGVSAQLAAPWSAWLARCRSTDGAGPSTWLSVEGEVPLLVLGVAT